MSLFCHFITLPLFSLFIYLVMRFSLLFVFQHFLGFLLSPLFSAELAARRKYFVVCEEHI